jgi:hypothetical protein
MRHLALALLFALPWAAPAQQRHESLRVGVMLAPQADAIHADVTVRIFNLSSRPVNVWVPDGIACWSDVKPGSVTLEWKFKGDYMNSARAVQGIQTTCLGDPATVGAVEPSREVRASKHVWRHFAPGQFAEIHDTLLVQKLLGGKYELRAVYTAPTLTPEQKQDLRASEIETPKGLYRSEAVSFTAPD